MGTIVDSKVILDPTAVGTDLMFIDSNIVYRKQANGRWLSILRGSNMETSFDSVDFRDAMNSFAWTLY